MIVQIGKYYYPALGGIENNTRQIAEIINRVYQCHVICMRPGKGPRSERTIDGVRVFELKSAGSIWRQQLVEKPDDLLNQLKPKCIHFHYPNPLLAVYLLSYLKKNPEIKLVITHHADLERPEPIRRMANIWYRALLKRAEKVVTLSEYTFNFSRDLSAFKHKIKVIPHGVQVARDPQYLLKNNTFSKNNERFIVGFLGRLEWWKGVQVLLDAVKELPWMQLKVAGEGNYRKALQKMANSHEIKGRVEFLGQVDGIKKDDFFSSIHALVLPSLISAETFGLVLVEAQAAGLPVVASDLPTGIQDILDKGRAGILFPPGNTEALKKALKSLQCEEFRAEIAKKGRTRAENRFSESIVAEQWIHLYREHIFKQ